MGAVSAYQCDGPKCEAVTPTSTGDTPTHWFSVTIAAGSKEEDRCFCSYECFIDAVREDTFFGGMVPNGTRSMRANG